MDVTIPYGNNCACSIRYYNYIDKQFNTQFGNKSRSNMKRIIRMVIFVLVNLKKNNRHAIHVTLNQSVLSHSNRNRCYLILVQCQRLCQHFKHKNPPHIPKSTYTLNSQHSNTERQSTDVQKKRTSVLSLHFIHFNPARQMQDTTHKSPTALNARPIIVIAKRAKRAACVNIIIIIQNTGCQDESFALTRERIISSYRDKRQRRNFLQTYQYYC